MPDSSRAVTVTRPPGVSPFAMPEIEIEYLRHGGILPYVLRQLMK